MLETWETYETMSINYTLLIVYQYSIQPLKWVVNIVVTSDDTVYSAVGHYLPSIHSSDDIP